MRRTTWRTATSSMMVIAIALGAIVFLYHKTGAVDAVAHEQYADQIVRVHHLVGEIDKDALSIRQGHLRHYDTLYAGLNRIAEGAATLAKVPPHCDASTRRALLGELARFHEAVAEKRDAIERFTSDRAILVNSLLYLPQLVESLAGLHSPVEPRIARRLRSALQVILVYNLHGTASDAAVAKSRIAELRALDLTQDEQRDRIRLALDHAEIILDYKPRVDRDMERILQSSARGSLDEMDVVFSRWHHIASISSNIYRVTLIIVCVLLASGLAYFIFRLRQAMESLHDVNEGLEQRVSERTQELSQMNVALQDQIEERQRATAALIATHARVQQILAIMPSILIGTDGDQRIELWNARAEEQFGIPASQALGMLLGECGITWDTSVMGAHFSAITDEPIHLPEVAYVQSNGQPGLLAVSASLLPSESGSGLLIAATDITAHKMMEAQFMQSQKLESIGHLAAGVAHEINTPVQFIGDNLRFLQTSCRDLAPVITNSQAVADGGNGVLVEALRTTLADADTEFLMAEMPKAIDQALEGVERVAAIVRALKEFSHPNSTDQAAVDLRKAIESTLNVARSEYKYVAEVTTDFDPDLPLVPCVQGEFSQVILNLVVNAAHAIGDVVKANGGKGLIGVSTRRDGEMAEIRISDNGSGIPESVRAKIFNPFFTTKEVGKGTGQGLYLAHAIIVTKFHGTITFETELGRGTTFIIRLPLIV